MKIQNDEWVWSQKYRPQTVADCILPVDLKGLFENIVKQGEFQSLLLSGGAGQGKTSIAKCLANDLDLDCLVINASEDNSIDMFRNKIRQFASTVSFNSDSPHKVVILDEADNLTAAAQSAFRAQQEEFSKNCRFILTANFKNKIIPPIQSRCVNIDFNPTDFRTPVIMKQVLERVIFILNNESIPFEKAVLAEIVGKWSPDLRKTINELQRYFTQSSTGKIDKDCLIQASLDNEISALLRILKGKDYKQMRQWIADHSDLDQNDIFKKLYTTASQHLKPETIPHLVLILGEYQYRSAFVVDQEINTAAALTEIMGKVQFL